MQGDFVETGEGPAFVRSIGSGPVVVVFHGGPGFDHRYLFDPLGFLAKRRTLVFYDQPGCGRTPPPPGGPSPDHTFRHALGLMQRLSDGRPAGVIAHSWGALALIAALAMSARAGERMRLREGLLINPLPVARPGYETARKAFIRRIPWAARARILWRALRQRDGARVMELLMPYYFADRALRGPCNFPLQLRTYLKVNARLGAFDHAAGLAHIAPLTILRGAQDFTPERTIADVIEAARSYQLMPGIGHFPFFEDEPAFRDAVNQAFD